MGNATSHRCVMNAVLMLIGGVREADGDLFTMCRNPDLQQRILGGCGTSRLQIQTRFEHKGATQSEAQEPSEASAEPAWDVQAAPVQLLLTVLSLTDGLGIRSIRSCTRTR